MSTTNHDRRGFPLEQPVGRDYLATVMHYVRWHAAAYGAPAPTSEIAAELHVPVSKARVLLNRMTTDGKLVRVPNTDSGECWREPDEALRAQGWTLPANAEAQRRGEAASDAAPCSARDHKGG